ncbi:MAG: type I glutamate--ammonia ligase [Myxococcota bacterium]|jgi:glutamine synthetase|nr:type I glutamate--ammonia ligase [Myxococcota bacterium]
MFQTVSEAIAFVREHHIENIDLKFAGLTGAWHHISLPPSQADALLFEEGVGFDGSSTGYGVTAAGDMVAVPDVTTGFVDPFWGRPTLAFLCRVADASTRQAHPLDPRGVAQRAEAYLRQTGIADQALFGPEYEYYLFGNVRTVSRPHLSLALIESGESQGESFDGPPLATGYTIPHQGGYHVIPPLDRFRDVRCETVEALGEIGVDIRYHHHEVGAAGQQEIEVVLGPLVRMADVTYLVKYFVKNVAARHNLVATFMPKPIHGEAGSGMHFHQYLVKEGEHLFYDASRYAELSRLAFSYIAGVLSHSRALVALTNPSTNSFKRLIPGFEAPVKAFFSLGNRTAAIRIPKYITNPAEKRMEFRTPDATCNPYLAMAAQLMAGLDGIRRNLDPEALGLGPFDFDCTDPQWRDVADRIPTLPRSLEEAFDALAADHAFLLEGGVFSEALLEAFTDTKRRKEILQLQQRPHPYELALYLNC